LTNLILLQLVEKLRREAAAAHKMHESRRHKLNLYAAEVDDLRHMLVEREKELGSVQKKEGERDPVRDAVVRELQGELTRLNAEVDRFMRDLSRLRSEKAAMESRQHEDKMNAERAKTKAQTELKMLHDQLDSIKAQMTTVPRATLVPIHDSFVPSVANLSRSDKEALKKLLAKHREECQSLFMRISTLQAAVTRELGFRSNLDWQKRYLFKVLEKLEYGCVASSIS
jgi:chromosome segregation ATPase